MAHQDQLQPSYNQNGLNGQQEPQFQQHKKRNNRIFWGIVTTGLIISFALCGVTGLVAYNANLSGLITLLGDGGQIAQIMPADTLMYGSVDLLNTQSADMQRIVNAFDNVIDAVDVPDGEELSLPSEFEETLREEFGMTVEEDIAPWIGRHIGFGLTRLEIPDLQEPALDQTGDALFNSDGFLDDVTGFEAIIAIESRNNEAADAFIEKFKAGLENQEGAPEIRSQSYQEVSFYSATDDGVTLSMGRNQNLVVLTIGENAFQNSIDHQLNQTNLASVPSFQTAFNDLPENRVISFYLNGESYSNLLTNLQNSAGPGITFDIDEITQIDLDFAAFSVTAEPEGLALDSTSRYLSLSTFQRSLTELSASASQATVSLLPDSTFFYLAGYGLGPSLGEFWGQMAAQPGMETVSESMDESAAQLGFHPANELLPILDGNFVIAAAQTTGGSFNELSGVNANLMGFFETSNVEEAGNLAIAFADTMRQQGFAINPEATSGLNVFNISDPAGAPFPIAYGVGNGHLTISTNPADMGAAFTSRPSIFNDSRYMAIHSTLPESMAPYLYINIRELLNLAANSSSPQLDGFGTEVPAEISPVEAMIAGQRFDGENNQVNARVMLIINESSPIGDGEQQASAETVSSR